MCTGHSSSRRDQHRCLPWMNQGFTGFFISLEKTMRDFYHKVAAPKCSLYSLASSGSPLIFISYTQPAPHSKLPSPWLYIWISLFLLSQTPTFFPQTYNFHINDLPQSPPSLHTFLLIFPLGLETYNWRMLCSATKGNYLIILSKWSSSNVDAVGSFASFTLAGAPLYCLIALTVWKLLLISHHLYTGLQLVWMVLFPPLCLLHDFYRH